MTVLDGRSLTCHDLATLAAEPVPVRLTIGARRRVGTSYRAAATAVLQRDVYGRTTGVGANRGIDVSGLDGMERTLALLRSHATSAGPLRSAQRVRATLLIRLNQLAAGGSGISITAVDGLVAMLEADALPPVREHAGIGTGDLAALATTALGLLGEVPLSHELPPIRLGVHDALPFVSSNAATLADAALAADRLRTLCRAALAVATLTGVAVGANLEAYSAAARAATPGPGAGVVCDAVLGLTGSEGTAFGGGPAPRIQDPFAMRCLPQVNGMVIDTLDRLEGTLTQHLNVAAENPVIAVVRGEPTVAHHGAFHIPAVSLGCDTAAVAVAQCVPLLLGRIAMLVDPGMTGLPPFLGDGTPGASGVMMLEYLAASALADLRASAAPASLGSVSLSRGTEEHASFASQAAVQLLETADSYATALACELVAAVRGVRMKDLKVPDDGWGAVLGACDTLGHSTADRDLTSDLGVAETLLPELADLVPSLPGQPGQPGSGQPGSGRPGSGRPGSGGRSSSA